MLVSDLAWQSQHSDFELALDFEKLLNGSETKRVSSTPDRMKHIEVKKSDVHLVAKDATTRNTGGYTSAIEEFLRTTGPERDPTGPLTRPESSSRNRRPSLNNLAIPSEYAASPPLSPMTPLSSSKIWAVKEESTDLSAESPSLQSSQRSTLGRSKKSLPTPDILPRPTTPTETPSANNSPSVTKRPSLGAGISRLFKRTSKSTTQFNVDAQASGLGSFPSMLRRSGSGTSLVSPPAAQQDSMPRSSSTSLNRQSSDALPGLKKATSETLPAQQTRNADKGLSESAAFSLSIDGIPSGSPTPTATSALSLISPDSKSLPEPPSTNSESRSGSGSGSGSPKTSLTDRQSKRLSMREILLNLHKVDPDFSLLGDMTDWGDFFKTDKPLTTGSDLLSPTSAETPTSVATQSPSATKSLSAATSSTSPQPIPSVLASVASQPTVNSRGGPVLKARSATPDPVTPPKRVVVSNASTQTDALPITRESVAKPVVIDTPAVPAVCLDCEQRKKQDEQNARDSAAKNAAAEAARPRMVEAETQYQTPLDYDSPSASADADADAEAVQAGNITPATTSQVEVVENPINMALVDENAALSQEIATLQMALSVERARLDQMRILKEAAEARFEQLARVAHRKLVTAIEDEKKSRRISSGTDYTAKRSSMATDSKRFSAATDAKRSSMTTETLTVTE
eukprot:jgi/Hompol1/3585/HPOL_002165-RA